ncbi:MAG: DUF4080 domain-containing protein [Clostridia bacterium]|nr:DUF4080 domain-containing protein [Clostridia bacterium]
MRNLLLIGINSKYTHSNLAIRYMRAFANVPIVEYTINDDIFTVYRKMLEFDTEFFCFSVYIWNVDFVKRLCEMLFTARPEIKIIFGGPEAGYDKTHLFQSCPWLFGIITGEGEEAIKALADGKPFSLIPNLSYRKENGIEENALEKCDLSKLVFPYTKEELSTTLKNKILYFETARGCLFRCAYCLSSAEGKTRFFPMEYVKQGLMFFMENKAPLVKFVDRTFNENNERALEIIQFILEHNQCTRFHFEVAPQLLTDDFIRLCARSPETFQFEMGIQTTNKETMLAIHRPYEPEKTAEKIKKIPASIHQHLDLIAGLPLETLESIADGFNFVYALKPHMLQLGFLKLLKHTKMYDMAKDYNIRTTTFPPFEVLSTDSMSASDIILLKKVENAVDRIYNSGAFSETIALLNPENPFVFYKQLGEDLYREEFEAPMSRNDLYVFMYKHFPEHKKSLVIDFLKNNYKAKLPEIFTDEYPDAKQLHKKLSKSDTFKDIKFRLVFAADSVFAISENCVTEIDLSTL